MCNNDDLNGEFSITTALRIYPTNDQVIKHNDAVLQYFRRKGVAISRIKVQGQMIDATRIHNIEVFDMSKIIPTNINAFKITLVKWEFERDH